MADDPAGLVFATILDGTGGGREIGWSQLIGWSPADGSLWAHLDRSDAASRDWLSQRSGLEPVVVQALLAEETRPRSVPIGDGLLVVLRGVNLNPGADPDDMVSVRLWLERGRVLSVRQRRVMAVSDLWQRTVEGHGPRSPGDLLIRLIGRLSDRIGELVEELEERADGLEEELVEGTGSDLRHRLREVRHQAIALRRHLAPQRDAVLRLASEEVEWLDHGQRLALREAADRVLRLVEDLDEIRERAAVVQDELLNRMSEQMNRNMYLLSMVATVMLPLGFVTGLLGINVGGIPLADSPYGFASVVGALVVTVLCELWLLRRLGML